MTRPRPRVTAKQAYDAQKLVATSLRSDEFTRVTEAKVKLVLLLAKVEETSQSREINSRLECFFWVICTLAHHERFNVLSDRELKKAQKTAQDLLTDLQILPDHSPTSFLYTYLFATQSLLARRSGQTFLSQWQGLLAVRASADMPEAYRMQLQFSQADRLWRSGLLDEASKIFSSLSEQNTLPDIQRKSQLAMLKITRLLGHWSYAEHWTERLSQEQNLPDSFARELQWEAALTEVLRARDMSRLMAAVGRKGSHNDGGYLCEAALWAFSLSEARWVDRLPDLAILRLNNTAKFKANPLSYELASSVQDLWRGSGPLLQRLASHGERLAKASELISLDLELLALLASIKVLRRLRQRDFALAVEAQYRALCQKCTAGQVSDLFGWLSIGESSGSTAPAAAV